MDPVQYTSKDGKYTRTANSPAQVVHYEYHGWTKTVAEAAVDEPLPTASKADWEKHAERLDIDVKGMTKPKIIAAVQAAGKQSEKSETDEPAGSAANEGNSDVATATAQGGGTTSTTEVPKRPTPAR